MRYTSFITLLLASARIEAKLFSWNKRAPSPAPDVDVVTVWHTEYSSCFCPATTTLFAAASASTGLSYNVVAVNGGGSDGVRNEDAVIVTATQDPVQVMRPTMAASDPDAGVLDLFFSTTTVKVTSTSTLVVYTEETGAIVPLANTPRLTTTYTVLVTVTAEDPISATRALLASTTTESVRDSIAGLPANAPSSVLPVQPSIASSQPLISTAPSAAGSIIALPVSASSLETTSTAPTVVSVLQSASPSTITPASLPSTLQASVSPIGSILAGAQSLPSSLVSATSISFESTLTSSVSASTATVNVPASTSSTSSATTSSSAAPVVSSTSTSPSSSLAQSTTSLASSSMQTSSSLTESTSTPAPPSITITSPSISIVPTSTASASAAVQPTPVGNAILPSAELQSVSQQVSIAPVMPMATTLATLPVLSSTTSLEAAITPVAVMDPARIISATYTVRTTVTVD